jgi:hypothetical protein
MLTAQILYLLLTLITTDMTSQLAQLGELPHLTQKEEYLSEELVDISRSTILPLSGQELLMRYMKRFHFSQISDTIDIN